MKKKMNFRRFQTSIKYLPEDYILIELDEWCFNNDDIVANLIEHFKNEGKECSYVGLSAGRPIVLLEDKNILDYYQPTIVLLVKE